MAYPGFPKALADGLACQKDGAPVTYHGEETGERLRTGAFVCGQCGDRYEIRDGIVMMLRAEQMGALATAEKESRDKEARRYDTRLSARFWKEAVSTVRALVLNGSERVVEYGCGTGRITTEIMHRACAVLAVDFSLESLRVLAEKISLEEVGLVCGDAPRFVTARSFFDRALAAQFIEHIPTREERSRFFECAVSALKRGGLFVATAYHQDMRRVFARVPQEGMHKNGIFYHYFSVSELQDECTQFFDVQDVRPIDIHLPFEARLRIPPRMGGVLSRISEGIWPLNRLGHLLLITGIPRRHMERSAGVVYDYPSLFFKKKWFWFVEPHDVNDADAVTFFSYTETEAPGFKRKKGLTTVIDLTDPIEVIWEKMRKNFVQKQIERGERNEIIIKQDMNFSGFRKLYGRFRRAKGIPRDNPDAFRRHGVLFSAYWNGGLVAGGVFIQDKKHMRAWALASLRLSEKEGKKREVIGQANRMILWEAVKYGKKKGCAIFDLGGIYPDAKDPAERSLSEFKEAFGGTRIATFYYHKTYSPLLKAYMRIRRSILL